jgi:hypothetical protein
MAEGEKLFYKVEATITWPPYVIKLYKHQEVQNVGFEKKNK